MANVNFKRGDTATMDATAIADGLIFLNTENHKFYFDNGTSRLQFGGDTTLINSVADAQVDNAFSGAGSVAIFAQKNSIVDTKANALAVTQPQIPLGCLAFKEAVGTTDISSVADGTISGAISELDSASTVYQQILSTGSTTVTYTDDRIDSDACFYFYADQAHSDLLPDSWSITGNTLTVVYTAQSENVTVGVQILKGVQNV